MSPHEDLNTKLHVAFDIFFRGYDLKCVQHVIVFLVTQDHGYDSRCTCECVCARVCLRCWWAQSSRTIRVHAIHQCIAPVCLDVAGNWASFRVIICLWLPASLHCAGFQWGKIQAYPFISDNIIFIFIWLLREHVGEYSACEGGTTNLNPSSRNTLTSEEPQKHCTWMLNSCEEDSSKSYAGSVCRAMQVLLARAGKSTGWTLTDSEIAQFHLVSGILILKIHPSIHLSPGYPGVCLRQRMERSKNFPVQGF